MTEASAPATLADTLPPAAETEGDSYLSDPELARLLSRLAALQGHAVPAFRFGMVHSSTDGLDVQALPRARRAVELWSARFPGAPASERSPDRLDRNDFPLLWVPHGDGPVLLVRGRLSHGAFAAEDIDGQAQERSAPSLDNGSWLSLRAQEEATASASAPSRSASEWFAFAISKHRRVFFEGVFATFMISAIGLVSSLYTMQVYDRVIPTQGFSTLWVLTVGVLLAVVLELTLKQVRSHMVDRASKAIDLELSGVFFGKALDIRMDARPQTVGTFASQIRHFESVRSFMTSTTLFILADAPFALFFIAVIGMLAGPLALVPLVMVPVAVVSGLLFRGAIERHTLSNMEESNRKNGLLIEAIDGIESVKAAGGEWKMLDRYRELTAGMAESELQLRALSSRGTNLTQTIQQLSYVGLVAAGAYLVTTGKLTMGGLIACSIISGRALAPLAQIPQFIIQWKHAKIALQALDRIMAMPSDRDPGERLVVPERCAGHLRLDKVAFHYQEDKPILDIASLSIRPGDRIAVLGAVGSGKTTLIKLLSGLYRPRSGQVFLDGVDMSHLAPEYVREHVGYLPQEVRLFNGSLRDNLTLGLPTPSDSLILRAAAMTGLDQVIQNHPKGLELGITEGGRGLSGGQRQIVGLTRLLLAQPRVMLLDEPTASMDTQLEARVMHHLFQEMPRDAVLVVVTHKLPMLAHVNRVIVVDRGRILHDGPRDEVLARIREKQSRRPAPAPQAPSEPQPAIEPVP